MAVSVYVRVHRGSADRVPASAIERRLLGEPDGRAPHAAHFQSLAAYWQQRSNVASGSISLPSDSTSTRANTSEQA